MRNFLEAVSCHSIDFSYRVLIDIQGPKKFIHKVLSGKKDTKVDTHISVNFSDFITNFVCLKKVIFIAF